MTVPPLSSVRNGCHPLPEGRTAASIRGGEAACTQTATASPVGLSASSTAEAPAAATGSDSRTGSPNRSSAASRTAASTIVWAASSLDHATTAVPPGLMATRGSVAPRPGSDSDSAAAAEKSPPAGRMRWRIAVPSGPSSAHTTTAPPRASTATRGERAFRAGIESCRPAVHWPPAGRVAASTTPMPLTTRSQTATAFPAGSVATSAPPAFVGDGGASVSAGSQAGAAAAGPPTVALAIAAARTASHRARLTEPPPWVSTTLTSREKWRQATATASAPVDPRRALRARPVPARPSPRRGPARRAPPRRPRR